MKLVIASVTNELSKETSRKILRKTMALFVVVFLFFGVTPTAFATLGAVAPYALAGDIVIEPVIRGSYEQVTVQPVYQRTVQPTRQKTIQPVWERVTQPITKRVTQHYLIPTFMRGQTISSAKGMVTRLTYDSATSTKANPVNGGAFKNGHTYVAVNVAAASAPGGVSFPMGNSSKNNGKKTPDRFNVPIDYTYNVTIANGKLTVSFDDRMVRASVGAYVAANVNGFPGNAPKHAADRYTVNMPANVGSLVYLYMHCESVEWYGGDYRFVAWEQDPARTTVTALPSRNELVSEKWLRDDVTEKEVDRTVTETFVGETEVRRETIANRYDEPFVYTVTDSSGAVVYEGTVENNDWVRSAALEPGNYTVTLQSGLNTYPSAVTVSAGQTAYVQYYVPNEPGEDKRILLPKTYLPDRLNNPVYLSDIILAKQVKAVFLNPIYEETTANPIQLGNETDAYSAYAKRLN